LNLIVTGDIWLKMKEHFVWQIQSGSYYGDCFFADKPSGYNYM